MYLLRLLNAKCEKNQIRKSLTLRWDFFFFLHSLQFSYFSMWIAFFEYEKRNHKFMQRTKIKIKTETRKKNIWLFIQQPTNLFYSLNFPCVTNDIWQTEINWSCFFFLFSSLSLCRIKEIQTSKETRKKKWIEKNNNNSSRK